MKEWFQERQKQSLVVFLLLVAAIVYTTLRSNDPDSPEGQVRMVIKDLVAAAENRDIGPFERHLSEDVQDEAGRNKEAILNTLRLLFLRHQTITLNLVRMSVDDNTNPDIISASLTLLMGETMVPNDRGNFFLTFRREGDRWKVWGVEWEHGYGY